MYICRYFMSGIKFLSITISWFKRRMNKSCQMTTTLAGRQPSLNSSKLKLLTSRSNFKVKVTRSKLWYHVKVIVVRNTHVQYESPISSGFKVMSTVKVFQK